MKMKMKMVLGTSLLALATSASAADASKAVATINNISGNVLIEQSGQRIPAKTGMRLQEGDSVFVLDNASIGLAYAGCDSRLEQNTLLTISAASPCAKGDLIGVGATLKDSQIKAMLKKYDAVIEAGGTATEAEAAAISVAEGLGVPTAAATEAAAGLAELSSAAAGVAGGVAGLSAGAIAAITGGLIVVAAAASGGGGGGSSTPVSP